MHAGDITAHGTEQNVHDFIRWFSAQPYEQKLFTAGNHDTYVEQYQEKVQALCAEHGVVFLNDSGTTVNGVPFWGSPITPRFLDWSFMRDAGDDIEKHWNLIPDDTRILVTHGPVYGILDEVERSDVFTEHTGCPSLRDRVAKIQPEYHVFGHIHEGYGQVKSGETSYLNVSTMDKSYRISNAPVVIEL